MSFPVSKLLIVMLVLAGTVDISNGQQSGGPPPPPPPPARDYSPRIWQLFRFDDGKFVARFPETPRESVTPAPPGGGEPAQHNVEYKGLLTYRISYVEYQVTIESMGKLDDLLQGIKSSMLKAELATYPDSKLVVERGVQVGNYRGLYVQIDRRDVATLRLEIVPVGTRLYMLSVAGHRGRPNEMEGQDNFEKIAAGFFGSFEVSETPTAKPK